MIDIQNNNLDENYTNGSYVEIDTSINTLETGQYHADCVNDEVKTKQTDERVQPTEANELNFSDSESYEDHTYCVKKDESSEKKEYLKNEKMSSDHNYFAKESIISPLSNDNINNEITNTDKSDHTYCAGQSNMYVPVETNLVSSDAQGQEDIVHSDVDTLVKDGVCSSENLIVATPEKPVCQVMLDRVSDDFEFDQKTGFTNGVADTNEDLSENIETDSFCENSTSEWMTDNPVCLSQNSSLISDTLNPQGVTYIKSLNADSETGGSPWKQTVTSPTCTMNYQDQSVFDHICVSAEKFEESQHKPILESPLVNEKLEVCSEYVLNVDSYLMEESFNDRDKTIIMGESVNNLVKTPLAPSSSKSPLSKDSSSVTSNLTNSELKKEILVNGDPTNSEIDGMSVATDSTEKNVRINCINESVSESPVVVDQTYLYSEYVLSMDSYLGDVSPEDQKISSELILNTKTEDVPADRESTLPKILYSPTLEPSNIPVASYLGETVEDAPCLKEDNFLKVISDSCSKEIGSLKSSSPLAESPSQIEKSSLCSDYVLHVDSYIVDELTCELDRSTTPVSERLEDTADLTLIDSTLTNTTMPSPDHANVIDTLSETVSEVDQRSSLKDCINTSTCINPSVHVSSGSVLEIMFNNLSSSMVESTIEEDKSLNTTMECHNKAVSMDTIDRKSTIEEIKSLDTIMECQNKAVSMDTVDRKSTIEEDKSLDTTMECHNKAVSMDTVDRKSTIEEDKSLDTTIECHNKAVSLDTVDRKSTIEEDKSLDTIIECQNKAVSMDTVDRKSTIEEDKSLDTTIECHNKAVSLDTIDRKSTIEEDKSLDTIMECQNKAVSMDTVDRKSTIEEDKSLDVIMECHNKAVSIDTVDRKSTIEEDKSLDTIMECHNKAVSMDTVDRKSASCSPIPLSMCDVSVQNIPDTHSAINSPFIVNEIKNTSVNTDITDTDDANVGTETPATIYVNIIKDQTEVVDKCIITDKTVMSEMWTNTDNHDGVSVGVEARPELETVYTEMVDLPMMTVGTSMTPVKLANKFGKR